jgi:hypothetical protein
MNGGLFVANQDVLNLVLLEQFVVNGQDGAAGIAEDYLYALINQGFEDDLCSQHGFLGHDPYLFKSLTAKKTDARPDLQSGYVLLVPGDWAG